MLSSVRFCKEHFFIGLSLEKVFSIFFCRFLIPKLYPDFLYLALLYCYPKSLVSVGSTIFEKYPNEHYYPATRW